ncbi:hypothetical protein AX15_006893 [Amanita polypyramis BW_CC]|nr:hypothetical protein AX15_006893 [Amanita polypyramis BW_CC]
MKKRHVAHGHDIANNKPDMVNGEGSTKDVVELEEHEGDDNSEEEPDEPDVALLEVAVTKAELTHDLWTIFSDKLWVCFKHGERFEQLYGCWCTVCRDDKSFVTSNGLHCAFFTGSNTSCHAHICNHYDLYKAKCEAEGIKMKDRCIPHAVWQRMQQATGAGVVSSMQSTLDGMLQLLKVPKEFSREALLHALAQLITCDDQAFALVSKAVFRNCLTMMWPKTKTKELPSAHDVVIYIQNEFIRFMDQIKQVIQNAPGQISVTANAWTTDTTSASFFGMTGHWIKVKDGKWELQSSVISFKAISGDHSSDNLAHYFVVICKCAGIMAKKSSKLGRVTINNASNNVSMCRRVSDIHQKYGLFWNHEQNQLLCLEHVSNLAVLDVMGSITKVATIENAQAIWEFDPTLEDNCMLGGSLDVIAAIQMIAIKVSSMDL